jgi:hypothetical protein
VGVLHGTVGGEDHGLRSYTLCLALDQGKVSGCRGVSRMDQVRMKNDV